jgi:hypothetical protein
VARRHTGETLRSICNRKLGSGEDEKDSVGSEDSYHEWGWLKCTLADEDDPPELPCPPPPPLRDMTVGSSDTSRSMYSVIERIVTVGVFYEVKHLFDEDLVL